METNKEYITKTAKMIFEQVIKYNHHFTMAKAIKLAEEKLQRIQYALLHPEIYTVNDNNTIISSYNYGATKTLDSIYGFEIIVEIKS